MEMMMDNDLRSMQEARILAENAAQAQARLLEFDQETLDAMVDAVARAVLPHVEELAESSHRETQSGCPSDKAVKNRFVCTRVTESLAGMRCVGMIHRDEARGLMDVGVPRGVIAALSPAASPVSVTLYNALIALKSGNAVVFSPHPRAVKTTSRLLDLVVDAAAAQGLPPGGISYIHTPTPAGARELMAHRAVNLVLNAGVPSLLDAAHASGKPVIFGGSGNGPAFIEGTADIPQAVADILASKTFDNGQMSGAEQTVVVESCIADTVAAEFKAHGAHFMTDAESRQLESICLDTQGKPNPWIAGMSAEQLARRAGITVPGGTRLLIARRDYVSPTDPYIREKRCPVLTWHVENDWRNACETCIELLLSQRHGHTLVIHSRDEEVIRQFALKKPVARVLVNTPAALGSMGGTTNLTPSMTLGSGSAGMGITSDNVSPMNLIYLRQVGYGTRSAHDFKFALGGDIQPEPPAQNPNPAAPNDLVRRIVEAVVEEVTLARKDTRTEQN